MYDEDNLTIIYNKAKKGIIDDPNLIDIKKELLFVINNFEINNVFILDPIIKVLKNIKKEGKSFFLNKYFLDFFKTHNDVFYLAPVLEAFTFYNERLYGNDIDTNTEIIENINNSFFHIFIILLKDPNKLEYLRENNTIYENICIEYYNARKQIILNNYQEFDSFILLNILDLVTTYVYINIESYNYDYSLISYSMDNIESDIIRYLSYFITNGLWSFNIGLLPITIGGFKKEFITIGNLVNEFYMNKLKYINKK